MFALVLLFLSVNSVTASLDSANSSDQIIYCRENERRALLTFKAGLIDHVGILHGWSDEEQLKECCQWVGVWCSNQTGHVIKLAFYKGYDLRGNISLSLLELSELQHLGLSHTDFGNKPIPEFFGSLTKLEHLDLSYSHFGGIIPSQLGNLSTLKFLAFANQDGNLSVENLDWLSGLTSLEHLNMEYIDLGETNWLDVIKSLPFLSYLRLVNCQLASFISPSLSFTNSSTSISSLDLSSNHLTSSMYGWLFNVSTSLVRLTLRDNLLNGPIPEVFGMYMRSLEILDLSSNLLDGMLPESFQNMCNLQKLNLSDNKLGANLSEFLDILSRCAATKLKSLVVDQNALFGSFPDEIKRFSSLRVLSLSSNQLNGSFSKNLGTLSNLRVLDLSSNSLEGDVSESHFLKLSNLTSLDLSLNPLHFKVSYQWRPQFQLDFINLKSCHLGPTFPKWIQTQIKFSHLDISDTGISDSIPPWFFDLSAKARLLNISSNDIGGTLPAKHHGDSLSSIHFEAPTSFPSMLVSLDLSRNKLSGTLSFFCKPRYASLAFLDVSHNQLTGGLPNCFAELQQLVVLNVAHNNLSAKIPSSIGSLSQLETLYLYNNSFSGELPMSLSNCTKLSFLDVGVNQLSGEVPAWIGGKTSRLQILSLRSNNFLGTIPSNLCRLVKLRILDLSVNSLSGSIPPCLNNLTAMVEKQNRHEYLADEPIYEAYGSLSSLMTPASYAHLSAVEWQGRELEFGENLRYMKSIDLSSNDLSGEIPNELTMLFELLSLNLSRNSLNGKIPQKIGQLKSLLSLDLSRNKISGPIPASFSQLNFLSYLDLSHNNLWGRIPSGSQLQGFDASMYVGNLGLCGPPLVSKCPGDEPPPTVVDGEDNTEGSDQYKKWLQNGMAIGFMTGFCGICCAWVLTDRRDAFFDLLEYLKSWFYMKKDSTVDLMEFFER